MRFKFGDEVTNPIAGDGNPTKHGMFVEYRRRTGRNNPGLWARCTDGKGKFWECWAETLLPRGPADG